MSQVEKQQDLKELHQNCAQLYIHLKEKNLNQLYFESYKESPDRQKENSRNYTDQETGAVRPHPAPYRPSQTQPPSRQGLPQSTSPLSSIETTPMALNTPTSPPQPSPLLPSGGPVLDSFLSFGERMRGAVDSVFGNYRPLLLQNSSYRGFPSYFRCASKHL